MTARRIALTFALAAATFAPLVTHAQADKATINALEGCFDFAASGGKLNGMISFTEIADRFEVEALAKQDKAGLLMTPAVMGSFEALKQSIKGQ